MLAELGLYWIYFIEECSVAIKLEKVCSWSIWWVSHCFRVCAVFLWILNFHTDYYFKHQRNRRSSLWQFAWQIWVFDFRESKSFYFGVKRFLHWRWSLNEIFSLDFHAERCWVCWKAYSQYIFSAGRTWWLPRPFDFDNCLLSWHFKLSKAWKLHSHRSILERSKWWALSFYRS